ncbi:inositol monophosphatase family protein [Longispora albida]|uniref:inositol monophosphatase family protein n=1 Tax=Longispora albida TaxID=203523 RepID=UPI000374E066|nr:inositol monophosphatase family protein [Longispora albida]
MRATTGELLKIAEECCREAVRFLRTGGADVTTTAKGPFDYVTGADTAVEDLIVAALRAALPGSAIVAEERGTRPGDGVTWYLDPIDGTGNFLRGLPMACVSLGAAVDGRMVAGCVYDLFRDECFTGGAGEPFRAEPASWLPEPQIADRPLVLTDLPLPGQVNGPAMELVATLLGTAEVRRLYCTALSLAWVAAGRADVACNLGIWPWDVAAGAALVEAAGGTYIPVGGESAQTARGFVAVAPGRDLGFGEWLAGELAGVGPLMSL